MLARRHRLLKRATDNALAQLERESLHEIVEEILTKVVYSTLGAYQQKVNVGIQDSVADLLETFKQKVVEQIFETASGWRIRNDAEMLFPPGCRYYYTGGGRAVLLIEQTPQVRSLLFDGRALGGSSDERLSLSLPYIYFVLRFKCGHRGERFESLSSYWSTRQAKSLDHIVALPLLPNTHGNGMVCNGDEITLHGGIHEQVEGVIGHYWLSKFNSDLSTEWNRKGRCHSRLADGRTWQTASVEDPMFILDAELPAYHPLDYVVKSGLEINESTSEETMRQQLVETVDGCVEVLFHKVLRYFKKMRPEKYYPKETMDQVAAAIRAVVHEISQVVLVLEHELNSLKDEVEENKHLRWKKRGAAWED